MKRSYLWRGLPGHPLHPPLTDLTIGVHTFATVAALRAAPLPTPERERAESA